MIKDLMNFYKEQSDYWEEEMELNPRQKAPRENYLRYHWEYRAYQMLLTHIENGNYDSEEYYNNYLNPKTKIKK